MPADLYIVVGSKPEAVPRDLWSEDEGERAKAILVALTRMRKIWFGEADWSLAMETVPTELQGPSDKLIALMKKEMHLITVEFAAKVACLVTEPDPRGLPTEVYAEILAFMAAHVGKYAVLVVQ